MAYIKPGVYSKVVDTSTVIRPREVDNRFVANSPIYKCSKSGFAWHFTSENILISKPFAAWYAPAGISRPRGIGSGLVIDRRTNYK